jgi:ubiquinone/menaquinone biosynthesis C-methylase UbiE
MTNSLTTSKWDYSNLAQSYEHRANYAPQVVKRIMAHIAPTSKPCQAIDIGAGTGKFTRPLLSAGCRVVAVEPNAAMHAAAVSMNASVQADWVHATAERLPLAAHTFDLACYASSFNVVDTRSALSEASRVLKDSAVLAILWNHRDLTDPLQIQIEQVIRSALPNFEYGLRRNDPAETVLTSGHFSAIEHFRCDFEHETDHQHFMSAWRSHATLARAASAAVSADSSNTTFERVLERIADIVPTQPFVVPFSTAVWLFRKVEPTI